ncbi:hypothetical protein BLNAU_24616 [Blattamonas nauphoetae]|uniref:Uncharacterized protein n=1 Tax=Blattamonas nauphoetae TaxID=2049346 RepID=A0ABQ9WLY2_9EUKA|nr:hypothetical protein BLNAU_24616 [Blattamonas nauphoetae]
MIETKRGTSGKAADAASGGCDDGEERAEQRRDLQFGQLVQFALSNFIPTNHIVHHLPQHHNPIHTFHQFSSVPSHVEIFYEVVKSNNERIANTHPSTATTDATTTAKAEPCPESLVRRLSGNARPSAPTNPSPLRPVSTHGDRRKYRIFGPIWRGSCSGANVGTRFARGCGMNDDSLLLPKEQHSSGTACPNPIDKQCGCVRGVRKLARKGGHQLIRQQNELRADRVGVQQFRQLRLFVSVQRQHKVKQLQRTHRTQAFLHNPLLHQLRQRLRNMKRRVLLDRRSETVQCRLQFRPEQQWRTDGSASAEQGIPATACSARRERATSGRMTASIGKRTETAEPARQTATPRSAVEKGTADQTTTAEAIQSSQIPVFLCHPPTDRGERPEQRPMQFRETRRGDSFSIIAPATCVLPKTTARAHKHSRRRRTHIHL